MPGVSASPSPRPARMQQRGEEPGARRQDHRPHELHPEPGGRLRVAHLEVGRDADAVTSGRSTARATRSAAMPSIRDASAGSRGGWHTRAPPRPRPRRPSRPAPRSAGRFRCARNRGVRDAAAGSDDPVEVERLGIQQHQAAEHGDRGGDGRVALSQAGRETAQNGTRAPAAGAAPAGRLGLSDAVCGLSNVIGPLLSSLPVAGPPPRTPKRRRGAFSGESSGNHRNGPLPRIVHRSRPTLMAREGSFFALNQTTFQTTCRETLH